MTETAVDEEKSGIERPISRLERRRSQRGASQGPRGSHDLDITDPPHPLHGEGIVFAIGSTTKDRSARLASSFSPERPNRTINLRHAASSRSMLV